MGASMSKAKKADKLTPKQLAFVEQYLVDFNAKQSAIRVGYSEKTAEAQGSRLLSNVKVFKAIAEWQSKRAQKLDISADRIERELAIIAFSDMKDFAAWGFVSELTAEQQRLLEAAHIQIPAGARVIGLDREAVAFLEANDMPIQLRTVELKPSEQLGQESRAVQSVSEGPHGVTIKLYDKQRALEMLARRHPEFAERKELTGKSGGPIRVDGGGLSDDTANAIREKILGVKAKVKK